VTGPLSTAFGFRATFISIGIFSLACSVVVGLSYNAMVER
jgi:hypothetical protein